MKIAIYAGEIPATTFIERLVTGLALDGLQIGMFGTILKPIEARVNVKNYGIRSKLGRVGVLFFVLRYSFLMSLFKPSLKRKLKKVVPNTSLRERAIQYSILWFSPEVFHLQWVKGVEKYVWVQEFGIKLIVSLRGAHVNYSPLADKKLADTYQKIFPTLDGFHGVSNAICLEASKYGADLNKCHVVYSGFNLEEFNKDYWVNNYQNLSGRPIQLLSVGRSHWKKGYHFALDAMKILKDNGVEFHYDIIGANGNEELMFQKHQLDLNSEVTFLNNVSFKEVKERIREADVLLLPSVEEGIANVVLEAMLLGTLVISTDCGGMEESITNKLNGIIIPVRNPAAISDAVIEVKRMDESSIQMMLEQAFDKISKQHSLVQMVKGMHRLYNSVSE